MKIQGFSPKALPKDIFTGVIIALVSIPISMGYAQVSGLPPVCGLYGSIFPILIFGLLSSSPQFIFGVDAAPAALVGAFLASAGIESGSDRAIEVVPMITFFVGMWLLLFFILKAGRLVKYISTPVMGGFISGISTTIILMQIPKELGGTSGSGELFELIGHIVKTCRESFSLMSLILGGASLALLLISKKLMPRLPMSVFVMAGGALIGYSGFAKSHGVACLAAIDRGLPIWELPKFDFDILTDVLTTSLTVAVVIMAETLLASGNFANKNSYKLDTTREILAYGLGNLAASFTGCCPVNGSVSRTTMGEQYGGRSQIMSITASFSMILILLFGTGFIKYLPVPVLTAIVISALLGAVEFGLAKRLFRQDKRELLIFLGAFAGVLIFGTVRGVVIGVVMSFFEVIANTADPKRSFLGVIPGREGFHSLERNSYSVPVKGAVIYRFSGNLYFANIDSFVSEIEASLKPETRCVVVDSGAICNIDITAADKIAGLERSLEKQGIKLYFASHIGQLNDRFRQLGIGSMVEEGFCRRTIPSALADAGFVAPYELEETEFSKDAVLRYGSRDRLEFEWAFGANADHELERYAERLLDKAASGEGDPEEQLSSIIKAKGLWKGISELDQEELLVHLQAHLSELSQKLGIEEAKIEEAIELRRVKLAMRLQQSDPQAFRAVRDHIRLFEEGLRTSDPQLYEKFLRHRKETAEHLREEDPQYAELLDRLYSDEQ
ncbi:MAG: SulP family inorganic anion transporter [Ruminococcus sp.]|nr:SulP family inorganic anion transporter [Ruminococcus sp.]